MKKLLKNCVSKLLPNKLSKKPKEILVNNHSITRKDWEQVGKDFQSIISDNKSLLYTLCFDTGFEAGHRLSKHAGKCFSGHGHSYKVHVEIESEILDKNDMVIDFSNFKKIIEDVLEKYDHSFMINKNDPVFLDGGISKVWKIVTFDGDPTSENMIKNIYFEIQSKLRDWLYQTNCSGIYLKKVTIFETSKCSISCVTK